MDSASTYKASWWHLAGAAAAGAALALSLSALTRQSVSYAAPPSAPVQPATCHEQVTTGHDKATSLNNKHDKQPHTNTATAGSHTAAAGSADSGQCAEAGSAASQPVVGAQKPLHAPSNSRHMNGEVLGFKPIGYLQTCFTTRNGTPRQPLLVRSARGRLVLSGDLPQACCEGLTQWSHVWVMYVFHENADSASKVSYADWSTLKAKVHVPRLNGAKQGLFATRTPHRPCPIGLSVAEVISVDGNTLVLGGADIVDGSPILDIKPYVPFCDSVPQAVAPPYVTAEMDEEPLAVGKVLVTATGARQLVQAWVCNRQRSLYSSAAEYVTLVCEILSRDIRALRQRLHEGEAAQQRNEASTASAAQVLATHELLSVEEAVAYSTSTAAKKPQRQQQHGSGSSEVPSSSSSSNGSSTAAKKTKKKKKASDAPVNQQGPADGSAKQEDSCNAAEAQQQEGSSQVAAGNEAPAPSQEQQQQEGSERQAQPPGDPEAGTGVFHVVIEGVDVSYDVGPSAVIIGGATLQSALAQQHAHKHRGK